MCMCVRAYMRLYVRVWSSGNNKMVCMCVPMLLLLLLLLLLLVWLASANVNSLRVVLCTTHIRLVWLWLVDSLSSDLVSMNACGCLFILCSRLLHILLSYVRCIWCMCVCVRVWKQKRQSICRFDASSDDTKLISCMSLLCTQQQAYYMYR